MLSPEVSELLLKTFSGRAEYIAYCPPGGTFRPMAVPESGIPVDRFAERHGDGGSVGLYLMRADNTVTNACVDFDDHGVNSEALNEAQEFAQFMVSQGFPCYLERSQSGSGGHVWFFFEDPLPAGEARVFLVGALSDLDMRSEVYPKQAKLTPDKPYGNLIRYPLSGQSALLDIETLTEQDPVVFMQGIQRISTESLMRKAWWKAQDVRPVASSGASKYQTEGLPNRVQALLDSNSLLMKRWMRDTSGMIGDTSNSSILFAVAVELIRNCIPTPEVEAAIRYLCGIWQYEKGFRTIEQTVANAYQNLVPKPFIEPEVSVSDESTRMSVKQHAAIERFSLAPPNFLSFGSKAIDASFGGGDLHGELTVIAGWPNHGKTTLAYQGLLSVAKQGESNCFISLEQTEDEITAKHLARLTDIPRVDWANPGVADELHRVLERDLSLCSTMHFLRGGGKNGEDNTLKAIVAEIHKYADAGIRSFVIDYLGAIAGCNSDKEGNIAAALSEFNQLVRKRHINIRLLVQLKRPDEKQKVFRAPTMFDLSGSTHIEQKSDNILAIAYPHKIDPDKYSEGLVSIYKLKCKNRSSVGEMIIPIAFDCSHQTFADSDAF